MGMAHEVPAREVARHLCVWWLQCAGTVVPLLTQHVVLAPISDGWKGIG